MHNRNRKSYIISPRKLLLLLLLIHYFLFFISITAHYSTHHHIKNMCRSKGCVKLFGVNILEQKQDHESNRSSSVTSFANLHYLEEPNVQVNAESLCEGQQLNFKRRKVVREKRKSMLAILFFYCVLFIYLYFLF